MDERSDNSMEPALNLPSHNAALNIKNQGWSIPTHVTKSSIPAAGNGRFAGTDVPCDTVLNQKLVIPMRSLDTLHGVPVDSVITFACTADLEKYIQLMMNEGGHTREAILQVFEHFIYGLDGSCCCLNVSTWTVNHAHSVKDGLNMKVPLLCTLDDGNVVMVCEAAQDIRSGDEIFMDYRMFQIPGFYVEFCERHGMVDVRTATLKAVGLTQYLPHHNNMASVAPCGISLRCRNDIRQQHQFNAVKA